MSELAKVEKKEMSIFEMSPRAMVNNASEMASVLAEVIDKQKLYTMIQGRKYVRQEGWATLGGMLGFLPREREVKQLQDGSYEAVVELYNIRSGQIVGQASAICGIDEKRWANAEKYARRSMAITRATGKAYRLGFAWVMALAGFESTPAEEIPDDLTYHAPQQARPTHQRQQPSLSHDTKQLAVSIFDKENFEHTSKLAAILEKRKTPPQVHLAILEKMHGRPMFEHVVDTIIKEVLDAAQDKTET